MPEAGWYEDPEDVSFVRLWDGTAWTETRKPKVEAVAPPPQGKPVQPLEPTPRPTNRQLPISSSPRTTQWRVLATSYAAIALLVGLIFVSLAFDAEIPDAIWSLVSIYLPVLALLTIIGGAIWAAVLMAKGKSSSAAVVVLSGLLQIFGVLAAILLIAFYAPAVFA